MVRYYSFGLLLIIAIIGFIQIVLKIKNKNKKIRFAEDYLNQLNKYLESAGADYETYKWLIHRSPKLQTEMGGYGKASSYSPPYSNIRVSNYEIILNIIPEIRKEISSGSISDLRVLDHYLSIISESIIRYQGVLNDKIDPLKAKKKNPFSWFHEGFSWIILIPFTILSWIGIFGRTIIDNISDNPIFKLIIGLITIVGLISNIVTIIIGWDRFVTIILTIIPFK